MKASTYKSTVNEVYARKDIGNVDRLKDEIQEEIIMYYLAKKKASIKY